FLHPVHRPVIAGRVRFPAREPVRRYRRSPPMAAPPPHAPYLWWRVPCGGRAASRSPPAPPSAAAATRATRPAPRRARSLAVRDLRQPSPTPHRDPNTPSLVTSLARHRRLRHSPRPPIAIASARDTSWICSPVWKCIRPCPLQGTAVGRLS